MGPWSAPPTTWSSGTWRQEAVDTMGTWRLGGRLLTVAALMLSPVAVGTASGAPARAVAPSTPHTAATPAAATASWGTESVLASGGPTGAPTVVASRGGGVIALWSEPGAGLVARRYDPARRAWSTRVVVGPDADTDTGLSLGADDAGNVLALWRTGWVGIGFERFVASRYDAGADAWSAPVEAFVAPELNDTVAPILAVGPAGDAFVAFRSLSGRLSAIRRDALTGVWGARTDLAPDGASWPALAVGVSGALLAWSRDGRLQVSHFRPQVEAWSAAEDPSHGAVAAEAVGVIADRTGAEMVFWRSPGGAWAARMTAGDASWSSAVSLPPEAVTHGASIEADDAGRVTIASLPTELNSVGYRSIVRALVFDPVVGSWRSAGELVWSASVYECRYGCPGASAEAISLSPGGSLAVAYRIDQGLRIVRLAAGGDQFEAAVTLDSAGSLGRVALDLAGTATVVWARGDDVVALRHAGGLGIVAGGPVRLFDTRPGQSPEAVRAVARVPLVPSADLEIGVVDVPGVVPPTGVGAVALTVTATNAVADGFVTVYRCGDRPLTSTLNVSPGRTVANAALAGVSETGTICFHASVPTDLVVDVAGWVPSAVGGWSGPVRLFDTRPGQSPAAARTVDAVPVGGDHEIEVLAVDVAGVVPNARVGSVALNVTATNAAAAGFVTVYPCGWRPLVSSLNVGPGRTVANAVVTPLSTSARVCFYSSVPTDLVVDVTGWFPIGGGGTAGPVRVLDTRPGQSPAALVDVARTPVGGARVLEVQVGGLGGLLPATGVGAVVLDVVATGAVDDGFVTVYPCGGRPTTSSVNVAAGVTAASAVLTPVSTAGTVCFYASAPVDLVVDLAGWAGAA